MASTTRVEKLQYKEILTPSWRLNEVHPLAEGVEDVNKELSEPVRREDGKESMGQEKELTVEEENEKEQNESEIEKENEKSKEVTQVTKEEAVEKMETDDDMLKLSDLQKVVSVV